MYTVVVCQSGVVSQRLLVICMIGETNVYTTRGLLPRACTHTCVHFVVHENLHARTDALQVYTHACADKLYALKLSL